MKSFVKKLIKYFIKQKLRKFCTFSEKVYFNRCSSINLSDGSNKEDIIFGENVRMYGSLTSQNHGKIIFKDNTKIGGGSFIGAVTSITIGEGTAIAHNVEIVDNNNHPTHPEDRKIMYASPWDSPLRKWKCSDSKPIEIGCNVWIGSGVRINKGVKVGDNSIIAAHSVVTKDVPPNSIAAGNPARIVKTDIHKQSRTLC